MTHCYTKGDNVSLKAIFNKTWWCDCHCLLGQLYFSCQIKEHLFIWYFTLKVVLKKSSGLYFTLFSILQMEKLDYASQ